MFNVFKKPKGFSRYSIRKTLFENIETKVQSIRIKMMFVSNLNFIFDLKYNSKVIFKMSFYSLFCGTFYSVLIRLIKVQKTIHHFLYGIVTYS